MHTSIETVIANIEKQIGRKVRLYEGQHAISVMEENVKELESFLEDVRINYPGELAVTEPEHKYLGIYEFHNEAINCRYYCIELMFDEEVNVSDIAFNGNYIPFLPDVWICKNKPSLSELYLKEVDACCSFLKAGREVLVVTGHDDEGDLKAIDVCTKIDYIIENYKTYRDDFDVYCLQSEKKYKNDGKYAVYIPSTEFRVLTGMDIRVATLEVKMPTEPWHERPFFIPSEETIKELDRYQPEDRDVFNKAVATLNKSLKRDKKHPVAYFKLEMRLRQLTRLLELESPGVIVEKQIELLRKSLRELEIIVD
ncbi:hypothetical protein [Butyrivibrio proteoclasticus]|uniref:hypothetical protein n=1 Tax=Butyrivibrio proteoclasticus TaxID=43305 RepID=UPI00047BA396|nr:hypothetical protein [Butyrivibrio proteoclasticus]